MKRFAALLLAAWPVFGSAGVPPAEQETSRSVSLSRATEDGGETPPAQPAGRRRSELHVQVHETQTFPMMGASAAWPIDASIVDASASDGRVTIAGRSAGTTKIVVISITGQNTLDVIVAPRVRAPIANAGATPQGSRGTAELRYSTAARELQNNVSIAREQKNRVDEVNVRTVHTAATPQGDRAETTIATASYRIFTKGRELTFFDREVDQSPLTLSRTPLRGVHYVDEHWRLHGGYTAFATYQSFFIPIEQQLVLGAGYAFRTGARSRVTPSIFAIRGEGTVLSLMHEYRDADRLLVQSELGYSNGIGAAAEVVYVSNRDRVRAEMRYRGNDFAVAGAGVPRGFFSDSSWSHAYGRGSTASLMFSATDAAGTRVIAGAADVDHRLTDVVALMGGASWGSYSGARNITIPAGVRLDFARGGIAALYRYAQSETNRGGHGGRISGRMSFGRWYTSAFVDRQQNAPTLDLVFAERPDLAVALSELGITATSPADIARALRENAALIELGFVEGVTVDLAPMRTQAGIELAFLGASEVRHQFRARLLRNVVESVATRFETTIATLAYSRRLTSATDVFASYSYWRAERRGEEAQTQPFAEIGVRTTFDRLPSVLTGTGTISGIVFYDEDLDGRNDGGGVDAVVELDGLRSERTGADGRFAFRDVPRGTHRVSAHVPSRPEAYFTTPSRVEVSTGETVAFGVASTAARVNGRVRSDADLGIGGVRVLLARGTRQHSETTASDGTFSFAAAPGEWQLSILTDSVPAGYSTSGTEARALKLDLTKPTDAAFMLRAHRSISGSAPPNTDIEVRPLNKRIRSDAEGRFIARSLPAGEITLVIGGAATQVHVPKEPVAMTLPSALPSGERARVRGESREAPAPGDWMVMIGAFRIHANAKKTIARAREAGITATLAEKGTLAIVRAGPYESLEQASEIAARLTLDGLEAVVMPAR